MEKRVTAVLVAAGSSTRMGFDKLSFDLGGETVVQRSIRAFAECPLVDEIVLVAGKNRAFLEQQAAACPKPVQVVPGGATRAESAKNGVLAAHGVHGGVIAACGTFFVFSDYMKPAVRMAALMQLPVKFIWTHDAFRVGEDGPTHEPVEQEAQIRLMEKLKNHHGKNSMLVLRPADAEETTVCWKLAMENTDTPSALILSRQNINMLPAGTDYSQAAKGAYIVAGSDENPDVIMVASGSEVSTLVAGAELLHKDGVKTRIVSVPSEGLFRSQSKEYQESILPAGAKVFGLTAGLPVNLLGLVGTNGKIWGLESFGFSAPYKVLDEKLGFTAENVYNQVKEML